MTVHTAKEANMVLFLDGEEMSSRGISAEGIDAREAQSIAAEVCGEIGIPLNGETLIEAFVISRGVMIFIRGAAQPEKVFLFASADDAMDAMLALPGRIPEYSTFAFYRGNYYLIVSGENEKSVAALSDFGEELDDGDLLSAYLGEHGHVIARGDAVSRIIASVR